MNNLEWLNGKEYEPLSKEETDQLFTKLNDGDFKVKDKIAKHNMRLILHLINVHFYYYENLEELFEVGTIALTKAINNYDIKQNFSFTTYASTCIINEITNFMRREKKRINTVSLNEPVSSIKDNDSIGLEQILKSNINIFDDYEDKELFEFINLKIETLKIKERIAIKMYFGFENKKKATLKEIGNNLNCSKAYAAKLIEKGLKNLKKELIKENYLNDEEELYKGYKKLY